MICFFFFCLSFHRELFWKPCAYQIYAKRSSNCELMLRHEKKKSSFFHHCLNSSSARERRDPSSPKIPSYQNSPDHHYRLSVLSLCFVLHESTSHPIIFCPVLLSTLAFKLQWVQKKDTSAMWEGNDSMQPPTRIRARGSVEKLSCRSLLSKPTHTSLSHVS